MFHGEGYAASVRGLAPSQCHRNFYCDNKIVLERWPLYKRSEPLNWKCPANFGMIVASDEFNKLLRIHLPPRRVSRERLHDDQLQDGLETNRLHVVHYHQRGQHQHLCHTEFTQQVPVTSSCLSAAATRAVEKDEMTQHKPHLYMLSVVNRQTDRPSQRRMTVYYCFNEITPRAGELEVFDHCHAPHCDTIWNVSNASSESLHPTCRLPAHTSPCRPN